MREGLTVAIVSARTEVDTSYAQWYKLRRAFLNGERYWFGMDLGPPERRCPSLGGEFGAVLSACLAWPAVMHFEFQLRALALQTYVPDEILLVVRGHGPDEELLSRWPANLAPLTWTEPMISAAELDEQPALGMAHITDVPRRRDVSRGCADKNTAIVMCQTKHLLVLDDCCLPGPGVVQAAYDACQAGRVFLPQHRQLYLPTAEQPSIRYADANTGPDSHIVMGICAAPLEYFLAINGWNTKLDGQRTALDEELKVRMDRYLQMRETEYAFCQTSRVYEFEHGYPWNPAMQDENWRRHLPAGFVAPGPSLQAIRDTVLESEVDGEEEAEEDENDGEA